MIIHCWKNTNFQKFGFIRSRLQFNNENFSSEFIKILVDIQKDFSWSKLQPKIKHSALIGNHEEGRL